MIKQYLAYLFRWQLSTPILAPIVAMFTGENPLSSRALLGAMVANFIGGLIFFWVDRFIFTSRFLAPSWEVKEEVICHDCGKVSRGYRLVKTKNYNKSRDLEPEFRCESCSIKKTKELKSKGIKI